MGPAALPGGLMEGGPVAGPSLPGLSASCGVFTAEPLAVQPRVCRRWGWMPARGTGAMCLQLVSPPPAAQRSPGPRLPRTCLWGLCRLPALPPMIRQPCPLLVFLGGVGCL